MTVNSVCHESSVNSPFSQYFISHLFRNVTIVCMAVGLLAAGSVVEAVQLDRVSPVVTRFERAEDVAKQWAPGQQVYVKGNVNVAEQQLNDLAEWLQSNGPHWTVVLMETAEGEYFEGPDGTQHYGMGAVEHALGYGLNNQTSIASLKHPVTQERDATIFILFLRERQFSYYSSEAQDKRGLGKSKWIGNLDKAAINAMRNGRRVVDAVKDTVKSITGGLDRKINNEILLRVRAQQAMWGLVVALILGLILAFLGFLWLLNRRRRPIMEQSMNEFRTRELSVRRETDQIDSLFTRNQDILGSREKIAERGYTGQTKLISEQAFNYVDDLFIMSKEVNRVVEEARSLIYPSSWWGKVHNRFSGAGYQKAMNLLSGKPVKFFKRNGLPWILREAIAERLGLEKPIDESKIPDEVAMTFEEIYSAFKRRGVEAGDSLKTIEDSLSEVHDRYSEIEKRFEEAVERERVLSQAASSDGYFSIDECLKTLLPSIQNDLKTANEQATFDAVEAIQVSLPKAEQKLHDFHRLCDKIDHIRQSSFPRLHEAGDGLRKLGYATGWFDQRLHRLGATANAGFSQAAVGPIETVINDFEAASQQLSSDADEALAIASEIHETHQPTQERIAHDIDEARREIAKKLKIDPDSVFCEVDRNPRDYLKRGRENLDAARTMLGQGRVEPAKAALETMQVEFNNADTIVSKSLQAVATFEEAKHARLQLLSGLRSRLAQLRHRLSAAQESYASAALFIQSTTNDTNEGNFSAPTISADSIASDADRELGDVEAWIENATIELHAGRVLAATEQLSNAEQRAINAGEALDTIESHLNQLAGLETANAQRQSDCEAALTRLKGESEDRRVMLGTIQSIDRVASVVTQNRSEMQRTGTDSNPFEIARKIDVSEKLIKELAARLEADRRGYAEAERAVAGAERQWEVAKQYVQRSQNDGITDSRKTTELNQRVYAFASSVGSIRSALQAVHGDWEAVDESASRLHAEISKVADALNEELQLAGRALQAFEEASQNVYQAEQWSGAWGVRVVGSHGVSELQQARSSLQTGNYDVVFQLSSLAASAARGAILQAERDVARRQMEKQMEAERARRQRDLARSRANRDFGGGLGGGIGGGFGGMFGEGEVLEGGAVVEVLAECSGVVAAGEDWGAALAAALVGGEVRRRDVPRPVRPGAATRDSVVPVGKFWGEAEETALGLLGRISFFLAVVIVEDLIKKVAVSSGCI